MKTFIYSIESSKISKTYGGANVTVKIYRIVNNTPSFVCRAKWCTRSYKGAESEVMSALVEAKALPKKLDNGKFQILEV